jgi:hypothetical protein
VIDFSISRAVVGAVTGKDVGGTAAFTEDIGKTRKFKTVIVANTTDTTEKLLLLRVLSKVANGNGM